MKPIKRQKSNKERKRRKCGICATVTDNTQLCKIGEDSVFLCIECSKDLGRVLVGTRRLDEVENEVIGMKGGSMFLSQDFFMV